MNSSRNYKRPRWSGLLGSVERHVIDKKGHVSLSTKLVRRKRRNLRRDASIYELILISRILFIILEWHSTDELIFNDDSAFLLSSTSLQFAYSCCLRPPFTLVIYCFIRLSLDSTVPNWFLFRFNSFSFNVHQNRIEKNSGRSTVEIRWTINEERLEGRSA